ncbi:unnamed protein product [Parajaminaea phylloscopi]
MGSDTVEQKQRPSLRNARDEEVKAKLRDYVSQGGDASQAARNLSKLVVGDSPSEAQSQATDSGEGVLGAFWSSVLSLVKSLPPEQVDSHRRLVDLIRALKAIDDGELEPWGSDPARPKLWQDLPFLGPTVRHEWNVDPSNPQEAAQSLSLATFVALLTETRTSDYTNYAVWDFRDTLEGRGTPAGTRVEAIFGKDVDEVKLHRLACCSLWVRLAGREIKSHPGSLILATPGGHLWEKGGAADVDRKDGRQRWAFWKEQAEALQAGGAGVSQRARELAGDVVRSMSEAEQSA